MKTLLDQKRMVVFIDFDNTISTFDVIDSILERFSKDDKWKDLEEKWKARKIGSRECLKGQIEGVSVTKKMLSEYIRSVRIDPYFKKLIEFLKSKNVRTIILSDNFDYILRGVLKLNGFGRIPVYSNSLEFTRGGLMPKFVFMNHTCGNCAHCKRQNLLSNRQKGDTVVYIGDGLSDLCASEEANIVFAKKELLKHYKENGRPCVPIDDLKDVYNYLKKRLP